MDGRHIIKNSTLSVDKQQKSHKKANWQCKTWLTPSQTTTTATATTTITSTVAARKKDGKNNKVNKGKNYEALHIAVCQNKRTNSNQTKPGDGGAGNQHKTTSSTTQLKSKNIKSRKEKGRRQESLGVREITTEESERAGSGGSIITHGNFVAGIIV